MSLCTSHVPAATLAVPSRFLCSFWKRDKLVGKHHSLISEDFATDFLEDTEVHVDTLQPCALRALLLCRTAPCTFKHVMCPKRATMGHTSSHVQQALAGEPSRKLPFQIHLPRIQRCQTSLRLIRYVVSFTGSERVLVRTWCANSVVWPRSF